MTQFFRMLQVFLLVGVCSSVWAVEEFNLDAGGYLLHGYDPVSYFQGDPMPGVSSYSVTHGPALLRFASAENMASFQANPEHYLPQFGGFCAYGARMGKKFDIDPLAFSVVDDRLYVLLNRSTHALWLQDTQANIDIAARLWPTIRDLPAASLDTGAE